MQLSKEYGWPSVSLPSDAQVVYIRWHSTVSTPYLWAPHLKIQIYRHRERTVQCNKGSPLPASPTSTVVLPPFHWSPGFPLPRYGPLSTCRPGTKETTSQVHQLSKGLHYLVSKIQVFPGLPHRDATLTQLSLLKDKICPLELFF